MDGAIKVAVVQGDRRRGAVAQALGLIADDVRDRVQGAGALVVPTLDELGRGWASTDRDALSATIDALLAAGAGTIDVATGKGVARPGAAACFDRFGYRSETAGRPVAYHDLDAEADAWTTVETRGGLPDDTLRVASRVVAATCRVSLSIARTHGVFRLGLGLPNLATVVHPDDRRRLEPAPFPSRLSSRAASISSLLESWRGWLVRGWLSVRSLDGGMMLTGPERRRLERIERATDLLTALAASVLPTISVVDGFLGMHGEGPRLGKPLRLGTVIAGTDAVAVDAVAAAIMGFDPLNVAYLRRAQAAGLGVADLAAITIVGEPWSQVRRKCRRHASDRLLRLVSGPDDGQPVGVPSPHFRSRRARLRAAARKSSRS
ncbi:MAG: DUF362 domain-containing protein [Paludisphaera borealis]|uniref:DUF362 domain-containing protein n=1 Tax=Paludisphaera borealis TaxID=1387353 RepID=UPI00284DAD3B|nr:DUF362 domain-containing protein [Paludisphaera borealis]MDR3622398.1 DUF362 domain-containing protein [Paludisphaera borealis]